MIRIDKELIDPLACRLESKNEPFYLYSSTMDSK